MQDLKDKSIPIKSRRDERRIRCFMGSLILIRELFLWLNFLYSLFSHFQILCEPQILNTVITSLNEIKRKNIKDSFWKKIV